MKYVYLKMDFSSTYLIIIQFIEKWASITPDDCTNMSAHQKYNRENSYENQVEKFEKNRLWVESFCPRSSLVWADEIQNFHNFINSGMI